MVRRKLSAILAAVMLTSSICTEVIGADEVFNYSLQAEANKSSGNTAEKEIYKWQSGGVGIFDIHPGNCLVSENNGEVSINILDNRTGKLSTGEDSFAYYGMWVPKDRNIEISCDMIVDLNTNGVSNPQQSASGLFILNNLYGSTGYRTNAAFLTQYFTKASAQIGNWAYRIRNGGELVYQNISNEEIPISASNYGPSHLRISKTGSRIVFECDGEVATYQLDEDLFTEREILVGMFAARDASAKFSNIECTQPDVMLDGIEVTKMPDKTEFELDEEVDLTGLEVSAIYSEGGREKLDMSQVTVYMPEVYVSGENFIELIYSDFSVRLPIKILEPKVKGVKVKYPPLYDRYIKGHEFNIWGLGVTLCLSSGEEVEADIKDLKFEIEGKEILPGKIIEGEFFGIETIKVYYAGEEYEVRGEPYGEFDIKFTNPIIKEIKNVTVNKNFYTGDECDKSAFVVEALLYDYSQDVVEEYISVLTPDKFNVYDWDTSVAGEHIIKIVSSYAFSEYYVKLKVIDKTTVTPTILSYPVTTFAKGEEFDPRGLSVAKKIVGSGEIIDIFDNNVYYIKNGGKYYEYGTGQEIDKEVVDTAGIWIDVSNYDSSVTGTTSVKICTNIGNIDIPISIIEDKPVIWKAAVFGQSTSTQKCRIAYNDAGDINISSLAGAGKITRDHDGIAYYYTRVDKGYNFELSGDITVNSFGQLNDGITFNGQEGFGIMARDSIPLMNATTDGAAYVLETKNAEKDAEGEPIPKNTAQVISSSIILAGAYSGSPKNNVMNLYTRDYMITDSAIAVQSGYRNIASTTPVGGSKYHITLKKINGGVRIKCYDYTSGETVTVEQPCADFLTYEDEDSIYVGFFTARWADIDVSNIKFSKSVAETEGYRVEDTTVSSPNISLGGVSDGKCKVIIDDIDGYYKIKVNDKWLVEQYTSCKGGAEYILETDGSKEYIINVIYVPYIGGEESLHRFVLKKTIGPALLYGDADGDEVLSSNDCALIMQYVLNKSSVNMSEDTVGIIDVDGDGIITANDAAEVLSKVLNSSYVFGRDR